MLTTHADFEFRREDHVDMGPGEVRKTPTGAMVLSLTAKDGWLTNYLVLGHPTSGGFTGSDPTTGIQANWKETEPGHYQGSWIEDREAWKFSFTVEERQ